MVHKIRKNKLKEVPYESLREEHNQHNFYVSRDTSY